MTKVDKVKIFLLHTKSLLSPNLHICMILSRFNPIAALGSSDGVTLVRPPFLFLFESQQPLYYSPRLTSSLE